MATNYTSLSSMPNGFLTQFADNYVMLAADMKDGVTDLFTPEPSFKGEQKLINRYSHGGSAKRKATEFEIAEASEGNFSRRAMYPETIYDRFYLDHFTEWKMAASPRSEQQMNLLRNMTVKRRDMGMEALFADVVEVSVGSNGERTTTTVSFPAGNQIAHNYSSGAFGQTETCLTIDKLNRVKELMFANYVGPLEGMGDQINVLVDAITWHNFVAQQVSIGNSQHVHPLLNSMALNDKAAFTPGTSFSYMGYNFRIVHGLLTDDSGYLRVPVFMNSGVRMGRVVRPLFAARDPHRVDAEFIQAQEYLGFVRIEDEKVYEVKVSN